MGGEAGRDVVYWNRPRPETVSYDAATLPSRAVSSLDELDSAGVLGRRAYGGGSRRNSWGRRVQTCRRGQAASAPPWEGSRGSFRSTGGADSSCGDPRGGHPKPPEAVAKNQTAGLRTGWAWSRGGRGHAEPSPNRPTPLDAGEEKKFRAGLQPGRALEARIRAGLHPGWAWIRDGPGSAVPSRSAKTPRPPLPMRRTRP